MSYRKTLTKLEAYTPQFFTNNVYCNSNGDCCALGALIPELQSISNGQDLDPGIDKLAELPTIKTALEELDLTWQEAQCLQNVNDNYKQGGGAHRYKRVIEWLQQQIKAK